MSRKEILENIAKNKPKGNFELPEINIVAVEKNTIKNFKEILPKISVKLQIVNNYNEISNVIIKNFSKDSSIVNLVETVEINGLTLEEIIEIQKIKLLDLAIINGDLAIAENGAIWVSDKNLPNRIVPFFCENLVLIIEAKNIVNNMHEAYKLQHNLDYNYGVFIAGPSKTADIEQCLVIGAQGPRNLMVILVEN
jgi:L-lactate dehydrogenase complex protein LldG